MSILNKKTIKDLKEKVSNKVIPLEKRKEAYKKMQDAMMNPKKNFDPETFDPMDRVKNYDIKKRPRKAPPDRLPTMGMKPKELLEGQMIGMFESKQDLYLLIAHVNNTFLERIEVLENRVAELEQKPLKNIK